jgi:hypothetical protein
MLAVTVPKTRIKSGPIKQTLSIPIDSRLPPKIQLAELKTMSSPRKKKREERLFTIRLLPIRILGTNPQVVLYSVKIKTTDNLVLPNHLFSSPFLSNRLSRLQERLISIYPLVIPTDKAITPLCIVPNLSYLDLHSWMTRFVTSV